ncbi:MAG: phosphoadenosine phosphosulfate reductase family protein, partial [Bacteroidales bacterium]|nr:phosphoadenosine phosphosulfate reductase family protein [Bacteroidales bacterium]
MTTIDLKSLNEEFKDKTPIEIIKWAVEWGKKPVVTTNFRPYEAAILHACTQVMKNMPVIWCDTGYNTSSTYKHAEATIKQLELNIKLYVPQQTSAHRDVVLGIPQIDDPKHKIFTEQVKLEPFQRAMSEHKPDVWFTNLRKGQTAFRDSI